MLEILNSFLMVAVTEMGDKTQLLAFVLASRYRKPWTIMAGIFVATVLNHLIAASLGTWISSHLQEQYLKWGLACIFIAFAIWVLIPDGDDDDGGKYNRFGPFITTIITFFLAEMGDKTQLSTLALAAQYDNIILVTIGTTLGMLFADGLAVFFGEKITRIIPMRWIHIFAAILYLILAAKLLL